MSTETTTAFKANRFANWLIAAGIIGLFLTIVFNFLSDNIKPTGEGNFKVDPLWYNHITTLIIYYAANSLLALLSGMILKKRKRIGVYTLILLSIFVLSSLFIRSDTESLFGFTFESSLAAFYLAAPIGVLVFVGAIFANLLVINKWLQFTRHSSNIV